MDTFLSIIQPYIRSYERIQLNRIDELNVQAKVLGILNLRDMGQLRDMYEGEHYYNLFRNKLLGSIALEKFLKIDLFDLKKIDKFFEPELFIEGQSIDIITSKFGEFPIIDKDPKKSAVIILNRDDKTFYICGLANKEVLKNNQVPVKTTVSKKQKSRFIGFGLLKSFTNLAQLKSLI